MPNWRAALSRFFYSIFGSLSWTPPPWTESFRDDWHRVRTNPRVIFGLACAAVLVVAATAWQVLTPAAPEAPRATFSVRAPKPPEPRKARDPVPPPQDLWVTYDSSVAALQLIGKEIPRGVTIRPEVAGVWSWVDDRTLRFAPKDHWPVGVRYHVHIAREVLEPHARLKSENVELDTVPMNVEIQQFGFVQDPEDPEGKNVFATLRFPYPVDRASLESRVSLTLTDPKTKTTRPLKHTITYDDLGFEAYVKSEALATPVDAQQARLTVNGGTKSKLGGDPYNDERSADAEVPGRYGVFSIAETGPTIVRDAKFDPEIVLVVRTTSSIDEKKLAQAIKVVELPIDKPAIEDEPIVKNYGWYDASKIGPEITKRSVKVNLVPVPAEHEVTSIHTFKLESVGASKREMQPGRALFVQFPKDLEGYGGYRAASDYQAIVRVPSYPQEVRIMHEGALLSVNGDRKLNVMVRGIPAVKIELARVLPANLNTMIAQTSGSFAGAQFNGWGVDQDSVTEMFSEVRELDAKDPRVAQYTTLDFGPLVQAAGGKRGIFFAKVTAWDKANNAPADLSTARTVIRHDAPDEANANDDSASDEEGEEPGEDSGEDEDAGEESADGDAGYRTDNQASDRRYVMVSDLGILIKSDGAGNQKVFVESVSRGEPVSGATVEVLGKNGIPVVTRRTEADGSATIPSLNDFKAEKLPIAWVVRNDGDVSVLPWNRYDRELDMSRFDVGGVHTRGASDALQAYAFSDRGIYRPGDTFHAAFMVKPLNWAPVSGVPVQLVVTDPRGIEVKKQRITLPESGYIELAYKTQETSLTGDYSVTAYLVDEKRGNTMLGSTSVRVEEFLPDRLKIEARIGDGPTQGWLTPEALQAHVSLMNLFGTPAIGNTVKGRMSLAPELPSFKAFPDYAFSDPAAAKQSYDEELSACETDEHGDCVFDLNLSRFGKSTYALDVYATGFELDGGRGVTGHTRALVSPRPFLVGVKNEGDLAFIKKDAEVGVRLVAIDSSVKAVDVADVRAVRIEEKYVSVLQQQRNGSYAYQSVRKEATLGESPVVIKQTGTRFKLPTDKPGTYIVAFKDTKDLELARVRYSVAGEANLSRSVERSAELELALDKKDYAVGESIEVSIKAPYAGSGLITIERDKVYSHRWFKVGTSATVQTITVPAGLEGNGYVSVAFLRASDSPEIFMSPLSYGTKGFSVSRKARSVTVSLGTPERVKPGDTLKITYATDRPAKIAVWGVDEGILQVARYQTPDPLSFFFEKRALEVRTKQILDLVLPEHHIVAQLLKQGGDGDGAGGTNLNPFRRKGEPPVAFWSGIIEAGPTPKTYTYKVPETFNGTMRIMAAALAPDAVGVAAGKTVVRGPFVISPNAPLFMAPGDTAEISVAIANNVEGSGKDAKVDVTIAAGDAIEVNGPTSQTVAIAEGHQEAVRFKVKALPKLGSAILRFTAKTGAFSASLSTDTSVRPASAFETTVDAGVIAGGSVDIALPRRLATERSKHEVTVSTTPLALAKAMAAFVEHYPHLCTEQVVSSSIPALVLRDVSELGDPQHAKDTLEQTLDVLASRQNEDGSFGYWTASSTVSNYATIYATLFLLEAADHGYAVAPEMRKRALGNLRELARKSYDSGGEMTPFLRSFTIYVLARAGQQSARELAELRDVVRNTKDEGWKHDGTALFMAAAYRLARDESEASRFATWVMLDGTDGSDKHVRWGSQTYAGEVVYIYAKHFPDKLKELDLKFFTRLAEAVKPDRATTITGGWTLLGLTAYAKADTSKAAAVKTTVLETTDTGASNTLKLEGTSFPTATFALDAKSLRLANDSGVPLFYAVTVAGFDKEPSTAAESHGVEIIRSYQVGKKTVTQVALGDEVDVSVKVRAPGGYVSNLALVELLPAGFDMILEGQNGSPITTSGAWDADYVDAREDRVVLYGSVGKDLGTVTYRIRATTRGAFVVPPTHAAAMYDPSVKGSSARETIKVTGD